MRAVIASLLLLLVIVAVAHAEGRVGPVGPYV
jgi:hypothetical protein